MSEPTFNRDVPPGAPPPTLDYRGAEGQPREIPGALLLAVAILFAGSMVLIAVFLAVTVSILLGHAGAGVMVLLMTATLLVGLGYYGHRRSGRMGIWIGMGIGLCALAVIFIWRAYWR